MDDSISSFIYDPEKKAYKESKYCKTLSLVEIFEHWVLNILEIPGKVLDKFYKQNNLSPDNILDIDVQEFIGDETTSKILLTLNRKYQQWQQKRQQKKQ